jgi:hypothetical protein
MDMFQLISLLIALGIGFACGYGVRELKSRRRRVTALKEYLRKEEQKRYDDSKGDVWLWLSTAPRISDTDGAPIVPDPTVVLSDQDLIGIQFVYVDGRVCEVIGVNPATPGAIRYRDLTNGIEGVLMSAYVRRAKQRQHLENQHLKNMEREGSRSIEVTD